MSVLVLAESPKGKLKKSAFEAVHYGHKTAEVLGGDCIALVIGEAQNVERLGSFGAKKVIKVDSYTGGVDSAAYANMITQVAIQVGAHTVVFNHSATGKSIAGRVAVRLQADLLSQVNGIPSLAGDKLVVTKPVFSGKAIATYHLSGSKRVFSLMGNAIPPVEIGNSCPVETATIDIPTSSVNIIETKTVDGVVPLPEAELVVSAGRGMKGPENWGIIEELATTIGATTACSRPVADTGWRPHHEHVGQTGVAIRPNLYIAAGISGAIQHLAGVNSSKCIVVINKDPEAPFFKAADYGVCADLFDVVPKLNEAFKKFKTQ